MTVTGKHMIRLRKNDSPRPSTGGPQPAFGGRREAIIAWNSGPCPGL
jgi:hypothetical protein